MGFFLSVNNGETWLPTGFESLTNALEVNNISGVVFAGNHTGVYSSQPDYESWNQTYYQSNVNQMLFVSNNNILVGFWGGIYLLEQPYDDGTQTLTLGLSQVINSFCEDSDGILYAGITSFIDYMEYTGGVYRSIDYGNTWEYSGLGGFYIKALACNSFGTLYAGSRGGNGVGIYYSIDHGTTWNPLKTNVFVTSIIVAPDCTIFIGCSNEHGTQGGVFRSIDNGATWELINSGLISISDQDIEGIYLSNDGYLYCYGDQLHRSTEPLFASVYNYCLSDEDISVFPNPANDSFQVSSSNSSNLNIVITNILGEIVFEQFNFSENIKIHCSSWPSGMYYYKIFNGSGIIKSQKIIIE